MMQIKLGEEAKQSKHENESMVNVEGCSLAEVEY